ncbi:MAG: hypothetical protein WD314_09370 [Trueperaceae bacterium]
MRATLCDAVYFIYGGPVDTTPPVISPRISGTAGSNGWYTSNVTVDWDVSDPESAVSSKSGCERTTVSSDTNGVSFTCSATSAGGTASESVTIMRDATPPTIGGSRSPQANTAGWNHSKVTVSFAASDATSGLAGVSPDVVVSSEAGGQKVRGTATDKAGNSASFEVAGISIDKTAPTISVGVSPARISPPNQQMTGVTADVSAADGLSGVASIVLDSASPSSAAGSISGATIGSEDFSFSDLATLDKGGLVSYSVGYTVTDEAGNSASADAVTSVEPGVPTTGPGAENAKGPRGNNGN